LKKIYLKIRITTFKKLDERNTMIINNE